jgi:hypothetical protein
MSCDLSVITPTVKARASCKRAEYYLSSDKRVIKGPGAPPRARASAS